MIKYPQTKKEDIEEEHFGVKIKDPYRWLEDDNSAETISWVKKQQQLTESILDEYPARHKTLERLKELNDYEKITAPVKRGNWYYFGKNDGLQNQYVIFRKKSLDAEPELFFDPNTLSKDGTTTAAIVGFSKNYRYAAFHISQAGADDGEFWIMDVESKSFLDDKLYNMRMTGAAWYKDGFFYSRYDNEQDYNEQDRNQKVYYHKLGDSQENDKLIYEDPEHPLRYNQAQVADDQRYLFIVVSEGTSGSNVLYKSLDHDTGFKTLVSGFEYEYEIIDDYEKDHFFVYTNQNAANYRLMRVNLSISGDNWQEVIPERDYLLKSVSIAGSKIIAIFVKDVFSKIEVRDLQGNFLHEIEMPYQGTAYFICAEKEYTEGVFAFFSYVRPNQRFHYDILSSKLTFLNEDPVKADYKDLISEQIFFESKDGCKVPMTLIYKNHLKKTGDNPVHLYGYGGYNISLSPMFDVNSMVLLEKGGIMVVVNLRGGGEYGESWHKQGMLLDKQNVFDDFICAAEYLIRENYTNPGKIAISGASNGGLLVAACMLQRPDLFKAALPMMGVLDMLRFHKFTCGWGWMVEYGNPEEETDFNNLLKYSPLHNVREGVKYPATMVVTADHDDRVIPGHSLKFAATLQEKADQELPLLLYTQFASSHASSSLTKHLEMAADVYSFMFKYLEM